MVPEKYSFDHIFFYMIPMLLSKAGEVIFQPSGNRKDRSLLSNLSYAAFQATK